MKLIPRKYYLDDFFDNLEDSNSMKCDIYEKDGDYHIEMDIPGFEKKDISIECDNGNLTITAEKEESENDKSKRYIKRERTYGKYQRSFYLGDVEEDKIKAEFKNGMLTIVVPQKEEKNTKKQIKIED